MGSARTSRSLPCCYMVCLDAKHNSVEKLTFSPSALHPPTPRHYTIKTSPEFSALKARLTEEIRVEAVLATEAH